MKKEQRDTVELVQRYLSTLDSHLSEIIGLDGANSGFVDIQNAYVDSLSTCMEKADAKFLLNIICFPKSPFRCLKFYHENRILSIIVKKETYCSRQSTRRLSYLVVLKYSVNR